MTQLGSCELEIAATNAAGNWKRFNCFVWYRDDISDPEQWAVIYTDHRDSGLLDQSNASVIRAAMQQFADGGEPDVVFESHSHWAVGHIDGFSVRVFRNGDITEAFQAYHELVQRMEDYPILDESDYSNREYQAAIENIEDAAYRLKQDFQLPADWVDQTYDWLSDHRCSEMENCDDQGGYPSEDSLRDAFKALGLCPID